MCKKYINKIIESNFTPDEQRLIKWVIKENPEARIKISTIMSYVSCFIGGELIVHRQTYESMLNEIYNCKSNSVDDIIRAMMEI